MLLILLIIYPLFVQHSTSIDITNGGIIHENYQLTKIGSPHFIKNHLSIAKTATLTIEPGTELRFGSGVMLSVNGTLIAKGDVNNRIVFTKSKGSLKDHPSWPNRARLVDERNINFGRLQIFQNGKWRGVCANYKNWTKTDVNVTCREMGFQQGNFSGFLSFSTNDSNFMLFNTPNCTGNENSILNCKNHKNVKIGSEVCLNQLTVHLHCWGVREDIAKDHWWGLEFYNSTMKRGNLGPDAWNESASILEYVDISYAGVDDKRQLAAAVRASPHVPFLKNVRIFDSAYDATNFTFVESSLIVESTEFLNNGGHGLVLETLYGAVDIRNSKMIGNRGTGIRAKIYDNRWPVFDVDRTFCRSSQVSRPTFPLIVTGIPIEGLQNCVRDYTAGKIYQRISVTVLEFDKEYDSAVKGSLILKDYFSKEIFAVLPINNNTMPATVKSKTDKIEIEFKWTIPFNFRCREFRHCLKFVLQLNTLSELDLSSNEIFINNTMVDNNLQHGIFVENIRNYLFINATNVSYSGYGAGIQVFGGAGTININKTIVEYNQNNGVNITYQGGRRFFNMSSFSRNFGNGLNITLNETAVMNRTRHAVSNQETIIRESNFEYNNGFGFRMGNSCLPGLVYVVDSTFIANKWDGINYESCFIVVSNKNLTNFTVGYSKFESNKGHAIRIEPMLQTFGRISNCTFNQHKRHSLLIDNTDNFVLLRDYFQHIVNYEIVWNKFQLNNGFYVLSARLTEGSNVQRINISYNDFRFNTIKGGFPSLNSRSRIHAVVIISSTNINFTRNHVFNPKSSYEISTQLKDRTKTINAAILFWETTDYNNILKKIFDKFSRFNLASINYWPVLMTSNLFNGWSFTTWNYPRIEMEFDRGDLIGGIIGSNEDPRKQTFRALSHRTYTVDRDINVLENGKLILEYNSKLLFPNAIGLQISGILNARGSKDYKINLDYYATNEFYNNSKIRLSDGQLSGRVEILPENETQWGTICKIGWTKTDASIACNMLGLVIHPDDYLLYDVEPGSGPVWRSFVKCTELDIDITECEADIQHSCDHSLDVGLRCHFPTWSGVRVLSQAQIENFEHVNILNAGLVDPNLAEYEAALRIDFNQYDFRHLTIRNSMSHGIEIFNAAAAADKRPKGTISNSDISFNRGSGIMSRYSYIQVKDTILSNNGIAGFEYNPKLTGTEARILRDGINDFKYLEDITALNVERELRVFFKTREDATPNRKTYVIELSTNDDDHFLVVQLIDWNPQVEQEQLTVVDGRNDQINRQYTVEKDVGEFPMTASQRIVTLIYEVFSRKSGRISLAVTSRPIFRWPYSYPWVSLINNTISKNKYGVITRFYNQESNEHLHIFHRYRFDTISLYDVVIEDNLEEAILAPSITKYHELYEPTWEERQRAGLICEVIVNVDKCTIQRNGGGIRGEHNHVEFANNVWIWKITETKLLSNKFGGLFLELPKVQMMYHEWIFNHSVQVNGSIFEDNKLFEFRISGFYCNGTIYNNRFSNNDCSRSCLELTGTEKDMEVKGNKLLSNRGKSIIEFFMTSHTPYTQWVIGSMEENEVKNNKPISTSSAAVIIKGVQNITIYYNIFSNPEMNYELLGGQYSSALQTFLDCRYNYWSTTDANEIRKRIFDFDDWNNYAIVDISPILEAPIDINGINNAKQKNIKFNNVTLNEKSHVLGGQVSGTLFLRYANSPYIIEKDLTVMLNGFLRIEAGVELQFKQNIGLLVLGSLTAIGTIDKPIIMRPLDPRSNSRNNVSGRFKRDIPHMDVRLTGGKSAAEGFVEFYNATERRWVLVCDPHFNDYTAMVLCRGMGFEDSNVLVTRSRYYDMFVLGYPRMHEQVIEWFWRQTFICDGSEDSLKYCRYKINFHVISCMENRQYVYAKCGSRIIEKNEFFWGNIRFSSPYLDMAAVSGGQSILEHVKIRGAGVLHGERAAAIESLYQTPVIRYVEIENCAWNGIDFIAPFGAFDIENSRIESVSGYGVGALVLRGDSNYENPMPSYIPLNESTIPYGVQGMVRMCTVDRMIKVDKRVIVYHKYSFENIDCIKIFRSKEARKNLGFRILQINLYNDTFYDNAIEIYQTEWFDDYWLLGSINATSSDQIKAQKYTTKGNIDTLGVRITASAAPGIYGFIAEVVSLPPSVLWKPDLQNTERQRIKDTIVSRNQRGGFSFSNVGELNPALVIENCKMEGNGYKVLNNTSPAVFSAQIQNSKYITFANNFIRNNYGGINIVSVVKSQSSSIYGNISNNVIAHNTHGNWLHISGHYFQFFLVSNNFIAHNNAGYRNGLEFFDVSVNFSNNFILRNQGGCIMNLSMPKQASVQQFFTHNAFWENYAIGPFATTIFARTAKHTLYNNFFLNYDNIYDLVTYNRTDRKLNDNPLLNAMYNWWGRPASSFVAGRIWDRKDDDYLVQVNHASQLVTNQTIAQGKCWPTWRLHKNKCYYFMGGAVNFSEAQEYCKSERSSLALAKDRDRKRFLSDYISSLQGKDYTEFYRVWVTSDDYEDRHSCTALIDEDTERINCRELHSFLCERDPYGSQKFDKDIIIIACSVTAGVILIVLLLIGFAILKRHQRLSENKERRMITKNYLRSSQASLHSQSKWDMGSVSSKKIRPRLGPVDKGHDRNRTLNITGATLDETILDSEYQSQNKSFFTQVPPSPTETSVSRLDSEYHDYMPTGRQENEIRRVAVPSRPVFDMMSVRSAESHPTIYGSRERLDYDRNFIAKQQFQNKDDLDEYQQRDTLPIRAPRPPLHKESAF